MKLKPLNRKGAIELSMTTVVVIVLSMTMLILGLVLIRNIFQGATYNVQQINDKVREQINSLFLENSEQKIIVYLADQKATIKQGDVFGVAFAIRNIDPSARKFEYTVTPEAGGNCPTTVNPANWIVVGSKGSREVQSGDTTYEIARFQPPLTTPLCISRFKVSVKDYSETFFDVQVTAR